MYSEIASLRREIIENEFLSLNEMQQRAVYSVTGPLLILAGAGSGKTTVLVNRIANLLRWGSAYETDRVYGTYDEGELEEIRRAAADKTPLRDELVQRLSVSAPAPWRILAITFTNKAANELKERICRRVGEQGLDIWASTFHSACGRILRSTAQYIGFTSHFTVYDSDDQKRLIKDCMKTLDIDEKIINIRSVMSEISNAKDNMMTPADFEDFAANDSRLVSIAKIYKLYQERLIKADAMDFDDMIFNTVVILRDFPEIREKYGSQFRYIMVDEYQDTNHMQYELVRLLSEVSGNLCVVGDDDQSIYRFRGATIRNILEFEDTFENTTVIKLEQNYRSTKNILNAANSVIRNNSARKDKTLWTANGEGEKAVVEVYTRAPKVKLYLNGVRVGMKKVKGCQARFKVRYTPGTLTALACDKNGKELARGVLVSAARPEITLRPEQTEVPKGGVVFVPVLLADRKGRVESNADRTVTVTVEGGELLGFGSANPRTEERFDSGTYTTYYGRALAAVRAGGQEQLAVTATDGVSRASVIIPVR